MAAWRFIMFSTIGTGSAGESLMISDMPFTDVTFTRPLSGVGVFSATIPVETALVGAKGAIQRFRPWSCMVIPDLDGVCMGCYLVTKIEAHDQTLTVEGESFVSYLHNMPYIGTDPKFRETDATTIAQWVINQVQTLDPASNLGLGVTVDPAARGTLLGSTPADQWPKYTNTTSATPPASATSIRFVLSPDAPDTVYYGVTGSSVPTGVTPSGVITRETSTGKLGWVATSTGYTPPSGFTIFGWTISDQMPTTDYVTGIKLEPVSFKQGQDIDLGQRFDQLAKDGGFDYYETHSWSGNGLTHTLNLVPNTGPSTDRDDLRFVVGENVVTAPVLLSAGDEQFTTLVVVGPGDGAIASWARADRPAISGSPRLSRYLVKQDDAATSSAKAAAIARRTLWWNGNLGEISEITVRSHPNAPIGSWRPGDWIWVVGSGIGWTGDIEMRVRVLDTKVEPAKDQATLTVLTQNNG